MSFIRWIPDATADMLLGNGEEQITWLGGKMQKHRDIQMRPNAREPKKSPNLKSNHYQDSYMQI